ncbi:hypothetical protein JHL18_04150 [Clostridium sp. YIM B02505]|uniref:Lipoprotein n=1 Tax=Clostridium yunnanense TaxID=2800325 RepID=A0ABS1EKE6_9CLOT|nr:hypothetical protein [Clostridium yunnanense]MBK1809831.1 hypothetical protein [Clostridium yunnanense]
MKRYIILVIVVVTITSFSGCSNTMENNKSINNKTVTSTKTSSTQENNDLNKSSENSSKDLEKSFKEPTDLKKPNIEEARNFEQSLKNGSVIMVSKDNSDKLEVYNISMLDKFLDSFNNHKEGYVRIIKGTLGKDGSILVNKFAEYETDGQIIKNINYDTYADKNNFEQGQPTYSPKIAKTYPGDGVRYSILESADTPDDMGATVISFNKSDIKN